MYRVAALSIAGSDSGGGAGIQADLAAFASFNVFGTTVLTAVTAQNPHGVAGVAAIEPPLVAAQMDAVFADFSVSCLKTGMLFSADIIRTVAANLRQRRLRHIVIDPVMVATSGSRLLREDAIDALTTILMPLATVATPNLPEAELLLGRRIDTDAAVRDAAAELAQRYGCVMIVKGGHGAGDEARDVLCDGNDLCTIASPREDAPTTHGTGCSLSAAMTACLALGDDPKSAAVKAKAYVLGRLRSCVQLGPQTWGMMPPERLPIEDIRVNGASA